MKAVLLILATFVGTTAFAKSYSGQYEDRTACSISIQKTSASTSVVQLSDAKHTERYEAQIVNRTHLGMKNGKVLLTVTHFSEVVRSPMIVAQSFHNGKVKTCTAVL